MGGWNQTLRESQSWELRLSSLWVPTVSTLNCWKDLNYGWSAEGTWCSHVSRAPQLMRTKFLGEWHHLVDSFNPVRSNKQTKKNMRSAMRKLSDRYICNIKILFVVLMHNIRWIFARNASGCVVKGVCTFFSWKKFRFLFSNVTEWDTLY